MDGGLFELYCSGDLFLFDFIFLYPKCRAGRSGKKDRRSCLSTLRTLPYYFRHIHVHYDGQLYSVYVLSSANRFAENVSVELVGFIDSRSYNRGSIRIPDVAGDT